MKNNIVVLKFGGTSMGSAETIQECMEVIKERIKQKVHPFVVVSAISKMTNTLLEMLNLAKNGKRKELITIFKDIKQRHLDIICQLTKNKTLLDKYNKLINEKFDYLNKMLDGILLLGDYSDKNQALICSFGEDLSSDLMELCLTENKISAEKIHSKELVKTNGDYLSADVDFTKTKLAFKKVKENAKKIVFVMTGFFGSNQDKEIMLLGRGGSDFSASIAGIALEVDMVEIWTDANGIMTADPRIVKTAKTWNKMNKDIASEMARAGAKVIHPKTISASHYGIPVIIKNLFDKSFKGTLINSEKCNSGVNGIVSDDGYSIIHFENPDMFEGVGYIAKLGLIASENNIPLDMAATSETSVSFTIKSNSLTNEALKYFEETANINVVNDVSKISIVGENINKMNILEKIFKLDPLRILRAYRFAAILDFRIEENTKKILKNMVAGGMLKHLTPERVWKEVQKALQPGANSSIFFEGLSEIGGLHDWFPEIEALINTPEIKKYHDSENTFKHTMCALTRIKNEDEITKWAVLTHDLGKGNTPVEILPHHNNHNIRGLKLINTLSDRLKIPNEYRNFALLFCHNHMNIYKLLEMRLKKKYDFIKEISDNFHNRNQLNVFLNCFYADYFGEWVQSEYLKEEDYYRIKNEIYKIYDIMEGVTLKDLTEMQQNSLKNQSGKKFGIVYREYMIRYLKAKLQQDV